MTAVKEDLIRTIRSTGSRKSIGAGRLATGLKISRTGLFRETAIKETPPIWSATTAGEMMAIGSKEELKEKADNCPENIELISRILTR